MWAGANGRQKQGVQRQFKVCRLCFCQLQKRKGVSMDTNKHVDDINYSIDFTNSRVILKNMDNDEKIADSKILEYHKEYHSIVVKLPLTAKIDSDRFSVLILTSTNVIHYLGTLRKVFNLGYAEIALYKGEEKEERKAVRYPINVEGIVDALVVSNQIVKLNVPVSASLINISSTGVLVMALSDCLYIGSIFRLCVQIGDVETTLYCNVVRMSEVDITTAGYGCVIVPPDVVAPGAQNTANAG